MKCTKLDICFYISFVSGQNLTVLCTGANPLMCLYLLSDLISELVADSSLYFFRLYSTIMTIFVILLNSCKHSDLLHLTKARSEMCANREQDGITHTAACFNCTPLLHTQQALLLPVCTKGN